VRFTIVFAAAILVAPAGLTVRPAEAGLKTLPITDVSAAKARKKKPAKPKAEYLKAAPGTGPSGPK